MDGIKVCEVARGCASFGGLAHPRGHGNHCGILAKVCEVCEFSKTFRIGLYCWSTAPDAANTPFGPKVFQYSHTSHTSRTFPYSGVAQSGCASAFRLAHLDLDGGVP